MADNESVMLLEERDEIARIRFTDRNILDESSIQRIEEEITRVIDRSSNPKILLNFENVEHLSLAALGSLIMINNRIKQKDGQLRLSNIACQIYEVFVITKLNKLFKIYNRAEEACKSFS